MKYLVKTLAIASALSISLSGNTLAGDADIDVLLEPESTFVEFGDGWYLRGDITASINGARQTETYSDGTTQSDTEFLDMIGYQIGAGYRFSNMFRADLTLGRYLSGSTESTTESTDKAGDCLGSAFVSSTVGWQPTIIQNCNNYNIAEYDTFALMGTGYFDIKPIGAFEPYVGAGLGVARVRWNEVTDGVICAPVSASVSPEVCIGSNGDVPLPNEVYRYGGTNASGIDYRLAYSLTAGFGYRVKKNLLIDFSYRYMGVSDTMGISSGASKAQSTAKDGFGLHQLNFDLRYEIW